MIIHSDALDLQRTTVQDLAFVLAIEQSELNRVYMVNGVKRNTLQPSKIQISCTLQIGRAQGKESAISSLQDFKTLILPFVLKES